MDRGREALEARIDQVSRGSGVKKATVRKWFEAGAQFKGVNWNEVSSVDELTLSTEEARILFYLRLTEK